MVRYFLRFSYIGSQYRGTQKQVSAPNIRNSDTIQGALEAALLTISPKTIIRPNTILASRTDAGVHALCCACHVELENRYNILYNANNVKKYVNRYFTKSGHTIRLLDFIPITCDFHARKSCLSRTYIYRFMIPKVLEEQRLPLIDLQHTHFLRAHNFDIDRVKRGTELFMGVKDFTTFSSKTIANKKIEYVRALHIFTLEESQSLVPFDPLSENFRYFQFVCKARSFLYNQVRRMVGTLFALGQNKITENNITFMFEHPSHYNWNPRAACVPSIGLHLVNLEYDQEQLKRCTISEEQYQKTLLEEQNRHPLSEEQELQKLQVGSAGLQVGVAELQLEEQKQELAK